MTDEGQYQSTMLAYIIHHYSLRGTDFIIQGAAIAEILHCTQMNVSPITFQPTRTEPRFASGRMISAPTGRVGKLSSFSVPAPISNLRHPSSVFFDNRFRSADCQKIQLFNFGMIATGNHNFERFAALCNTPGGSQGVLAVQKSINN